MFAPTHHPGRGRGNHHTFEEAQEIVQRWQASGQGPHVWCRNQGMLPSTLASCRQRVGRTASAVIPVVDTPAFLPVRRQVPRVTHEVVVESTGHATVRLSLEDLATLMRLIGDPS